MTTTAQRITDVQVEADTEVPVIRMTRDFHATPEQLFRAHTDPELFAQWVGPADRTCKIDHWECRTGGSWRYLNPRPDGSEEEGFHGSFHEVRPDRLVQTFTWEGYPDGVSLETMTFEDLGDGWTRLHAQSLLDSFEVRDMMISSGMESGVNDGYVKLDAILDAGGV